MNPLPDLPLELHPKPVIQNDDTIKAFQLYEICKQYLAIKKFPVKISLGRHVDYPRYAFWVKDKLVKAGYDAEVVMLQTHSLEMELKGGLIVFIEIKIKQ